MSDIDRIIESCRRDSRTVSGVERRALCDEIERLRAIVKRLIGVCRWVRSDEMLCRACFDVLMDATEAAEEVSE